MHLAIAVGSLGQATKSAHSQISGLLRVRGVIYTAAPADVGARGGGRT